MADHPLSGLSLKARYYKCFGDAPQGFGKFAPFNVLVGRNNSGKSSLLDLVEEVTTDGSHIRPEHKRGGSPSELIIRQALNSSELQAIFSPNAAGGGIPGNSQWDFGQQLVGQEIERIFSGGKQAASISEYPAKMKELRDDIAKKFAEEIRKRVHQPFRGLSVKRIAAERDIIPETSNNGNLTLQANGTGATNIIRAFINKDDLPREIVEEILLNGLNQIYASDNSYEQIVCQENSDGNWEIFLKESSKGLIRISDSGSGLKTVLLVLINFLLVPRLDSGDLTRTIFAFEELENSLHPALLRRLFGFLVKAQNEYECSFVLTTHSSVTIDWFSRRKDSQIIHVTHDGENASCVEASTYLDNRNVLDDLEVRASDILQSNGIIWVEGPSDRYYLRRWIDLWSDGELSEGTHYQCLFYGGRLLSHLEALPPADVDKGVALLAANRNVAVLMDSDRKKSEKGTSKPPAQIGKTKRRIRDEIDSVGGLAWITEGREIENYVPTPTWRRFLGRQKFSEIDKYDCVFDKHGLGKYRDKKPELAEALSPLFERSALKGYLDLGKKLDQLCNNIRAWNGISAA